MNATGSQPASLRNEMLWVVREAARIARNGASPANRAELQSRKMMLLDRLAQLDAKHNSKV